MLSTALGRNVGDSAFKNLKQGLLDPFTRHVSSYRGVLVFAANLVDLIDIDDALLAFVDVTTRSLEQFENDVLDVLTDVTGFC